MSSATARKALPALHDVPEDAHRGSGHHQHQEAGACYLEGQDGALLGEPLGEARVALRGRPEQPEHQVLDEERHADRGDERNQPGRVAQRPVGHPLHQHSHRRREEDRHQHDQRQAEEEVGLPHPVGIELLRGDEPGHRPDHEHLAVGEVDEAEHAVDHRVAQGDEAVHRALGEAGNEQALELVTREAPGARVAPPGERVVSVELLPDEGQQSDDDHGDQEDPYECEKAIDGHKPLRGLRRGGMGDGQTEG